MVFETRMQRRSDRAVRPGKGMAVTSWERVSLALVLPVAAILDFWQLDRVGYGNTYYAAAVRSMLQSWHNFFFNAFDPAGFVSIDKPPLAFWAQTLSAELFGFREHDLVRLKHIRH